MKFYRALTLCLGLLAGLPTAYAQFEHCDDMSATLSGIRFEGNRHTREITMRRELHLTPGQPLAQQDLSRARQALLDLGLFRSVELRCEVADTSLGMYAVFTMQEKHFFWAAPRADTNSDGDHAYGAHMSWHNLMGRNQTLRATVLKRESSQNGHGTSLEYRLSHDVPFLGYSAWGLRWNLAHEIADVTSWVQDFSETTDRAGFMLNRRMFGSTDSQGLRLGAGLEYTDQHATNDGPDFGRALSLQLAARWRDRRNRVYSESGYDHQLTIGRAQQGYGSDYNLTTLNLSLDQIWSLGKPLHETLGARFELGLFSNGPRDKLNQYSLGGANQLRGYEKNSVEGDAYALLRLEYFRPTPWPWLRWGPFLEAGGVWGGLDQNNQGILASAGLGVQIRPPWFVGLVINLGMGCPLISVDDNSGPNFYGSGR